MNGLALTHDLGVVHRDLKPANILLTADGTCKIADLGIGALLQDDGEVTMLTGVALDGAGTPIYADPRRLLADPAPADDIYALGMIGVQLLLGDLFRPVPHDWIEDAEEAGAPEFLIVLLQQSIGRAVRRPANASAFLSELGLAPSEGIDRSVRQRSNEPRKKDEEQKNGGFCRGLWSDSRRVQTREPRSGAHTLLRSGAPRQVHKFEPHSVFCNSLPIGKEGPEMVVIPTGRFLMGSPEDEPDRRVNEGPQREVIIDQSTAFARYAATFDEYDTFCIATLRDRTREGGHGRGRGRHPVINVGWDDALAYCAWLSDETGFEYRLPSEAE